MKVAKEQIVGMVAAVDWLLDQNDEADQAEYTRRANIIIEMVKDIPTMKSEIYYSRDCKPRAASDPCLRSKRGWN